jgi:hypothetical protein
MSDMEKNASENSPAESEHSVSDKDLSNVSASESELVGDDTKSLNFEKSLFESLNCSGWLKIECLKKLMLDYLRRMRQFLGQNLMNVLCFVIILRLVFVCHVKIFLKKF